MEKEVSDIERKIQIRNKYSARLTGLLNKEYIEPQEFYETVRDYFSEFLHLEDELTFEEISNELEKIYLKPEVKSQIDDFLFNLSEAAYLKDKELEQQEIRTFISQFFEQMKLLVDLGEESIEKKKGFMQKLFGKNTEEVPQLVISQSIIAPMPQNIPDIGPIIQNPVPVINEMPAKTNNTNTGDLVMESNNEETATILRMIEKSYMDVDYGNIEQAKNGYLETLEKYHVLDVEDKKKVYHHLYVLYEKLRSM